MEKLRLRGMWCLAQGDNNGIRGVLVFCWAPCRMLYAAPLPLLGGPTPPPPHAGDLSELSQNLLNAPVTHQMKSLMMC